MPLTVESHVELIPGYRLIERLGSGGFGEVWKAEAPGGMHKAIKIIHGSLSDATTDETRLKQELKALHRVKTIRHPYILSLERFDIVDGRLIIVSELADRTLFDRFKECRMQGHVGIPREELLRYMEETSEALDLMNEQFNLQHLDIKPQNIFLLFNHVKVGDFGLVKDLEGMFAAVTCGVTAVYAAPETFDGVVSRYCDQYNLAIAYQEMLTGKLPFDGTTARQLMLQHVTGTPDLSPLAPADQKVIGRALSKRPEERYPSCVDFVHALRRASGSNANGTPALSAPTDTPTGKPTPWPAAMEFSEHPTSVMRPGGLGQPPTPIRPGDHPIFATAGSTPAPDKSSGRPTDLIDYVPPPPPERTVTTGDGVLLPALVVGLGGLGRDVLQEFRTALRKRGTNESWPHIRLLNLDTDPEAHERATREPDSVLNPDEILVTPFHRLAHYLKRQHEREELGRWLPLGQLTSVARGQTTAEGWRALGRLALVSCANTVPLRLRQELLACANEETVTEAARRTSLGLRTTCPRVYVVTSLTGGTGSGMFLDLARSLRHELRQVGHPNAELVGVFLVPPASRDADPRSVANGFAALRELKHFAKEKGTGPFDRCVLLPLPANATDAVACQEVLSLAGDYLCRELTTPLGREADEGRNALERSDAGMRCQTFGAYWFSVPRRPLLHRVVQHLCDRLVRGWGVHDSDAMAGAMQSWVNDQLAKANLSSESLPARLEEGCASGLGHTPKEWFGARTLRWQKGGAGDLAKGPAAVHKAMKELVEWMGPADREPDLQLPSPVITALWESSRAVAKPADGQLAEMALGALDEPRFRLACQEEAAQEQLGVALGAAARAHRGRSEERHKQAKTLWEQIPPVLNELEVGGLFRAKAKARATDSIRALLAQYLSASWDSLLSLAASRVFQDLQGNLHKYRRAVDCCHKRIGQFLTTFADPAADAPHVDLGLGRYLLPFGCHTLEEAVACILDSLPAEEERPFHDNVWNLIQSTLKTHMHVCTTPMSLFRELRERIDAAAEKVAIDSLGRAHAAEMYLERQNEHLDADADLSGAFAEAQPELGSSSGDERREFSVLAVPPGPEGDRFRALVKHALPDVPMRSAASIEDITFYREHSLRSLDELPQLGPVAQEVYIQFLATAQFGPHSRTDIAW